MLLKSWVFSIKKGQFIRGYLSAYDEKFLLSNKFEVSKGKFEWGRRRGKSVGMRKANGSARTAQSFTFHRTLANRRV